MTAPPDTEAPEEWVEEPPFNPEDDEAFERELHLRRRVNAQVDELRIRDAAAQQLRREQLAETTMPAPILLGDFLAVPDEPQQYRVDGLWPIGGRVVLAAAFKAGKTTLLANLVRALVDGSPFLDQAAVTSPDGRVVIIDDELDERMLRRWLRDQGIEHPDRVAVVSLRGKVATFDLLDPAVRAVWAAALRGVATSVVVLDCLAPVLDALGLSEDKEAGRFLVAFDALLDESGASEGMVIHHMGHGGERARGASRLRDWPDVEWRLLREKDDENEQAPEARRYFAAYGRDVDHPEALLEYEHATRRLSLAGGTRRDTEADALIPDVLDYLRDNPGASQRGIEAAMREAHAHPQKKIRKALSRAIHQGRIDTGQGPRNATLHFAVDPRSTLQTPSAASAASASPARQRGQSECGSASIGDALHSHSQDDAVRHDALPADHCPPCDNPRDSLVHTQTCRRGAA